MNKFKRTVVGLTAFVSLGLVGFYLPAAMGHTIYMMFIGTENCLEPRDGVDYLPNIPQPMVLVENEGCMDECHLERNNAP